MAGHEDTLGVITDAEGLIAAREFSTALWRLRLAAGIVQTDDSDAASLLERIRDGAAAVAWADPRYEKDAQAVWDIVLKREAELGDAAPSTRSTIPPTTTSAAAAAQGIGRRVLARRRGKGGRPRDRSRAFSASSSRSCWACTSPGTRTRTASPITKAASSSSGSLLGLLRRPRVGGAGRRAQGARAHRAFTAHRPDRRPDGIGEGIAPQPEKSRAYGFAEVSP